MGQDIRKWTLLIGAAVVIHVAAFAIWQWVAVPFSGADAGGGGLRIALAPSQTFTEDQSETEATDTNEPVPPVVEPVEASRVEPVLPDKAEPVEEAVRQPEQSDPVAGATPPASAAVDASNDSTGKAAGDAGTADAAVEADYLARLTDWLTRHMRYPDTAIRRNMEGVAELTITLTRQGELVSYSVSRSAGYAILDREARELLQRARPLPAFPVEMTVERMEITIPVRFELE